MAKSGPIIIIEDDVDDESIMEDILKDLKISNKLVWFTKAEEAFRFLKTTSEQPFIIFCDVNLPRLNGVEFKRQIDNDKELRKKKHPLYFLFHLCGSANGQRSLYPNDRPGFFQKK